MASPHPLRVKEYLADQQEELSTPQFLGRFVHQHFRHRTFKLQCGRPSPKSFRATNNSIVPSALPVHNLEFRGHLTHLSTDDVRFPTVSGRPRSGFRGGGSARLRFSSCLPSWLNRFSPRPGVSARDQVHPSSPAFPFCIRLRPAVEISAESWLFASTGERREASYYGRMIESQRQSLDCGLRPPVAAGGDNIAD